MEDKVVKSNYKGITGFVKSAWTSFAGFNPDKVQENVVDNIMDYITSDKLVYQFNMFAIDTFKNHGNNQLFENI